MLGALRAHVLARHVQSRPPCLRVDSAFWQETDLYDPRTQWASYLINALKAKELQKRNVNYIVRGEEVLLHHSRQAAFLVNTPSVPSYLAGSRHTSARQCGMSGGDC